MLVLIFLSKSKKVPKESEGISKAKGLQTCWRVGTEHGKPYVLVSVVNSLW